MDFYLVAFLLIVIIGLIVSYIYFMKEKKEKLLAITNGICPKCHKATVEIIDQRGGGCSGTKMVTFECRECKYRDIFNIDGGSCATRSCSNRL